jgi:hypothetical protein
MPSLSRCTPSAASPSRHRRRSSIHVREGALRGYRPGVGSSNRPGAHQSGHQPAQVAQDWWHRGGSSACEPRAPRVVAQLGLAGGGKRLQEVNRVRHLGVLRSESRSASRRPEARSRSAPGRQDIESFRPRHLRSSAGSQVRGCLHRYSTIPARTASAAASTRLDTPILERIRETWTPAVLGLMNIA